MEQCPLDGSAGRLLREPVLADRELPPFDRVMMDGFAVRRNDLQRGRSFRLAGSALAGMPRQVLPDEPMSAMEVMTGSPLPIGADTIIPVEETVGGGSGMRISDDFEPLAGQYIHCRGSDQQKGDVLVSPGTILKSTEIGIAASCGYSQLLVSRAPVVSIFGSGNELVPVAEKPEAHQIRQSNVHAVQAALSGLAIELRETGILTDDIEKESARLGEVVASSDIVILSGAVSKGKLDWIPASLDKLGDCLFHGVNQRPGKPMGVWTTESGCMVFALPGNPVSTLVCAHRFVIPYIQEILGVAVPVQTVTLEEPVKFDPPMTLFLPVKRTSGGGVVARPANNSGDYAALASADGFVELGESENNWTAGAEVSFYPWR